MEHFSHEHQLILNDVPKNDDEFCNGCGDPISSGPFYSCEKCSDLFVLHKVCAELPCEMEHPMNSQHPLFLLGTPPYPDNPLYCQACNFPCEIFVYYCSSCEFINHISCALWAHRIEHECHEHTLIPLQQPASFLCHACGDDHKAVSFKCGCCPFWVHQSCTLLPSTLKHSDHDHLLTLTRSLPDEFSIFSPSCDICCKEVYALIWVKGNEVFTMNWVYYCAGCRYFAHVNCATSKRETSGDEEARIEAVLDPNPILLPVANSSLDLVAQFVKRSHLEEIKMTTKLEHFGHGHPLTLFDEQMSNELCSGSKGNLCEARVEPILAPFYGCTQCNYFLHKCCAELPTKIWHPFHTEHPLDLLPEASEERSLNWCECCFKPCNGFSFKCSQCLEFCLDVKCGSLSGPIKHVAHKHLLTPKSVPVKYCSACGRLLPTKFGFVCDLCDFILDTRCAMLPSAFKHRYDKHPVILTYSPIKNHPAKYYCELCEEEVNPKRWFYHCVDCDQSIDIWCMYRYNYLLDLTIKKGESLKFDSHPHPLTVIGFSKDPGFFCNGCGNLYKYSLLPWLECGPCKLKLHLKCAGDAVKKGEVL